MNIKNAEQGQARIHQSAKLLPVRLSIITPTLNPGPNLERTIQSVLSQEFKDLEHLIIDGGSSDGTIELAGKYHQLRVIRG